MMLRNNYIAAGYAIPVAKPVANAPNVPSKTRRKAMSISIITPAVSEPLSLTDVKEFLRVDHSDDDVTLAIMISAARELCEQYTRQILMTTTIEEFYDTVPGLHAGR
jgi:hypothetical protein